MVNQFKLPDVGEGLTEAEIVSWRVAVGDIVELNQLLLEVETAKAVVELPSPYAGTVLEIHHQAGEVIPVGSPLITVGLPSDDAADPDAITSDRDTEGEGTPREHDSYSRHSKTEDVEATAAEPDQDQSARAVLVGYGVRNTAVARRPRHATAAPSQQRRESSRPLATPPLRKLARNMSVDLAMVTPTGLRGEITRTDIHAAAQARQATPTPSCAEERIPIKGARKYIAEAMVRSAFTAPHVTEWVSVDVTRSLKLIDELRAAPSTRDLRITLLTLLARATIITLARYREMNASWDEEAAEIVRHLDINLGIAVASPRGLIVPNILAAQTLDFVALSHALTDLVAEARANRTSVEAMRNGTFTISNIGIFGVDGATPIINPGESAILALGQTRKLPWNHKNRVRLRLVSTLSLSFDHRLVDGELGSKVLTEIAQLLEQPSQALAR